MLATATAGDGIHLPVLHSIGFGSASVFGTAGRRVIKAFFSVELLFACGPGKLLAAVFTDQGLIGEITCVRLIWIHDF